MYKQIIVALLMIYSGAIFGMQEENTFKEAIQKNIIPILAVNNYVMPVSSVFRALKRESMLPYESLEKIHYTSRDTIKNKNDRIKVLQEKKYDRVYQIPFINNRQDVLDLPSGCFLARSIEIIYIKHAHVINAYITALRHIYRAEDSRFGAIKDSTKKYVVGHLPKSIIQKLPQELSTCYLLHSGDEYIADRVVIKNMCNLQSSAPYPLNELSIDEHIPCTDEGHDIHLLNDDIIEDYDICLPVCRRMMAIVGFLLFVIRYLVA